VAEAVLAHRPEFERATPALPADLAVERPLGLAERVWGLGWVRKLALLAGWPPPGRSRPGSRRAR
jgi:hypothetical protein